MLNQIIVYIKKASALTPGGGKQEYIVLLAPAGLLASHLLLGLFGLASKWLLLGRQRPGSAELYSRRYIAWWTNRAVQHHVSSPWVAACGSSYTARVPNSHV